MEDQICNDPIFAVEEIDGRYAVRDLRNGKRVRFSYQVVRYGNELWNNFYSARCFAQKLQRQVAGHCA